MSGSNIEDVVQKLQPLTGGETEQQPDSFINEDDVLEIEEVDELEIIGPGEEGYEGYEGDEDAEMMEPESDDDQGDQGHMGEEGELEGDQIQDGALDLLDNGLDDAHASYAGHEAAVFTVAIHPIDSILAVSGGADDLGHLWRTDNGELVLKLEGHEDSVTSVGFSFDGEMVATGGMDGRVRVWRRVRGSTGWFNWEFLMSLEGPDEVNWLDWHPKGNLLLCGGADGTVWLWQLPTGNTLYVLTGHIASVTCGRFTPDGKKIITCSEDSTLILWDPKTGDPIFKLLPADGRFRLNGGINSLAVNPASTVAICGGAQGGLRAVNLVQGTVLAQMAGHEDGSSIEAVGFSEIFIGGGVGSGIASTVVVLVSCGTDGRVCTWEANTFKLRATGIHEDAVTSLTFAPNTTTFITGSADKTLKVWDYRRGTCERTLLGHRDVIHTCAVSKDGKKIISGGEDGLIKVFGLAGESKEKEAKAARDAVLAASAPNHFSGGAPGVVEEVMMKE